MLVYHGSVLKLRNPDTKHSKQYLDFGKGFYVTTCQAQAEKWALRKGMRSNKVPVVNVYCFDENAAEVLIKKYLHDDEVWLDFVCDCRSGKDLSTEDIIAGPVADDDVFKTVNMYFRGLWDKNRTIEELRYYKKSDQIVFKNDRSIQTALRFLYSYEVKQT